MAEIAGAGLGIVGVIVIVIVIGLIFLFIYGAVMVYWYIPAATEAISDRFFDRWEQSQLFKAPITP